jgi:hypothetical protein
MSAVNGNQIATSEFRLTLPTGAWTHEASGSEHTFSCGDREEVIVSVLTPDQHLSAADRQATLVRLFSARVDAILQLAGPSCRLDPVTCSEAPDRVDAGVFGHAPSRGTWLRVAVIATAQRFVTVSYFDYTAAPSPDQFRPRADQLFSSIVL